MADGDIRWGWLKGMYLYTVAGAGILGLFMLFAPVWLTTQLGMPSQDRFILGIVGSNYVVFGLLAMLGLRWPLRFVPILLLQMGYKITWLLVVMLPHALAGNAPPYAWFFAAGFLSYVLGDLVAIPFRRLFVDGPVS